MWNVFFYHVNLKTKQHINKMMTNLIFYDCLVKANILQYNILTLPLPSLKTLNRMSFYENIFFRFCGKRNYYTLFLTMYYDCLVKVRGGSIYNGIIFWHPFPPPQKLKPRWLSWMRRPTGDQEVAGSTPAEVGNILSWRLIMKYFLRSFSPFRWFKKGSCQFLAKECAQYWLTA